MSKTPKVCLVPGRVSIYSGVPGYQIWVSGSYPGRYPGTSGKSMPCYAHDNAPPWDDF